MPPVKSKVATAMMFYMSAQNELSGRATENIEDIMANVNLDNLQIYIMNDTINAQSSNPEARGTYEIRLPAGATAADFETRKEKFKFNEVATNKDVFDRFLRRAEEHFELLDTQQKILVLWGHGRGLVMLDEVQSDGTTARVATIPAFAEVLEARATAATDRLRFDLIAFDSCYMGVIEAMNQFRTIADFALVSCTAVDAAGYPYQPIIAMLKELGPGLKPETAASLISEEYDERYKQLGPGRRKYLFVCDMKKIGACVDALNTLGRELHSSFGPDRANDPVRDALRLATEAASGELPEYPAVLSFINKLRMRLKGVLDPAQFEWAGYLLDTLKYSVHAAFSGQLGDTGTIPTSPLIWCPTQKPTFTRYQDLYNELDASAGGSSGWTSMWRHYHDSERPAIRTTDKKNKFEFCCSV